MKSPADTCCHKFVQPPKFCNIALRNIFRVKEVPVIHHDPDKVKAPVGDVFDSIHAGCISSMKVPGQRHAAPYRMLLSGHSGVPLREFQQFRGQNGFIGCVGWPGTHQGFVRRTHQADYGAQSLRIGAGILDTQRIGLAIQGKQIFAAERRTAAQYIIVTGSI